MRLRVDYVPPLADVQVVQVMVQVQVQALVQGLAVLALHGQFYHYQWVVLHHLPNHVDSLAMDQAQCLASLDEPKTG